MACRLQEWTGHEGAIRLSSDEGPSAQEFIEDEILDDDDEDVDDLSDEPLPSHVPRTARVAPPAGHAGSPQSLTGVGA